MTTRFTTDPPLASADTWAGRQAKTWIGRPAPSMVPTEIWIADREAQLEAIWHGNIARRDQAAKDYGEPETPHEFYAGRPGSKAEKVVLDCLRELQAIPEADRLYAHELTDAISKVYLETARTSAVSMRRITALMRIAVGEKA